MQGDELRWSSSKVNPIYPSYPANLLRLVSQASHNHGPHLSAPAFTLKLASVGVLPNLIQGRVGHTGEPDITP
jgi:hypothetical protein